jgi:hypothetical protein
VFDRIKRDLVNFPNQIIETWLVPFACEIGWPPPSESSEFSFSRWNSILNGKPLSFWQRLVWERKDLNLNETLFTENTKSHLSGLLDAYVRNVKNDYYYYLGKSGLERFKQLVHHLMYNGELPEPIIFLKLENGLELLDGTHRLAAYMYLLKRSPNDKELGKSESPIFKLKEFQTVWIGVLRPG